MSTASRACSWSQRIENKNGGRIATFGTPEEVEIIFDLIEKSLNHCCPSTLSDMNETSLFILFVLLHHFNYLNLQKNDHFNNCTSNKYFKITY